MVIKCEHCGEFTRHDAIDALLEQRAALAAELRALREQIQMIRDYNDALRQKRDTLRKSIQDTTSLAHELGWNGVENSKIMAVFLRDHIDTLRAEAARLREALGGAANRIESIMETEPHLHLAEDLALYRTALSSTPTTAEWLAARDAEQRRISARGVEI